MTGLRFGQRHEHSLHPRQLPATILRTPSRMERDMMLNVDWMIFYLREQGDFSFRYDGSHWKEAGLCPFPRR